MGVEKTKRCRTDYMAFVLLVFQAMDVSIFITSSIYLVQTTKILPH